MPTICVIIVDESPDEWINRLDGFVDNTLFVSTGEVRNVNDAPSITDAMDTILYAVDTLLDERSADPQDFKTAENMMVSYGYNRALERDRRERAKAL